MHELGILDAMIHTIEDVVREEGAEEVERIVLDVGELSGVVPRYLEECWPAARYKTSMEETELEVCVVPGIVKCRDCGSVFNAMRSDMRCPKCEGQQMEILSGNDLMIKEILCK